MTYIFSSLSSVPLEKLTACFNLSFSDYFVKMVFTEKSLEEHLSAMSYDAVSSFGAFYKGDLVSFTIVGIREDEAFVIAVGTVPEHRKKGLQKKIFSFVIPALKNKGIKCVHLECIEENVKASKLYAGLGFVKKDRLLCYSILDFKPSAEISSVISGKTEDGLIAEKNTSSPPTWQNQSSSWLREKETKIKLYKNGKVVYSPRGGVFTISGEKDESIVLLGSVFSECGKVRLINIREKSDIAKMLESLKIEPFSTQGDYLLYLS